MSSAAAGRRGVRTEQPRAGSPRHAGPALAVLGVLALAACTAQGEPEVPDRTPVTGAVAGSWTGPGTAYLDVDETGAALGSDGCNRLEAELSTVDEPTGRFRVTSSTEALCVEIPSWNEARTFSLIDDELVVESADGDPLTVLTRDD